MQRLYRKRIVLGVGGGIAAYKSAELVRRLRDQGAEVRVVMTQGGREFITTLTLQALSGHPVHTDLLDPAAEAAIRPQRTEARFSCLRTRSLTSGVEARTAAAIRGR